MADAIAHIEQPFDLKPLMFETFVCTIAMMSLVALIGPLSRELGLLPWQAGTAVTMGGVAWMLCARVWGVASDRHGRRRILLRGLSGFVIFYAGLCVFAIVALELAPPAWLSFAALVILRGACGGFYAAVPATAGALVADHVAPERRAGALAGIGAASAFGMVTGPGIAGLLATHSLELPFYITAALPAVALVVLWRWLPRTEHHVKADVPALKIGDARLRRPLIVAFVAMFCVSIAQVTVGFFALDRLQLPAADAARVAGIALTCVGVALVGAQLLVRKLGWPPARFIRIGGAVSALGFGSVMFAHSAPALWAGYFVAAAGMGWVFPSVPALAANSVDPHEQGAAAGTIGAAHGCGTIVGPLIGTLIYAFDTGAPFMLIAVLLLITMLWPQRRAG